MGDLSSLETDILNAEMVRQQHQKEIADLKKELEMETATVNRLNNTNKEYTDLLNEQNRQKALKDHADSEEHARQSINDLVGELGKGLR